MSKRSDGFWIIVILLGALILYAQFGVGVPPNYDCPGGYWSQTAKWVDDAQWVCP